MKPGWSPAAAALLLGLALGAAAGSWGQRAVSRRRMMQSDANRQRLMLDKLSRELGLDERQKAAVSAVMDSKKVEIDQLKTETFVRLEAIRKSADGEMAKALTPEQAAKLEAMHHRGRPMHINWDAPPSAPAPAR